MIMIASGIAATTIPTTTVTSTSSTVTSTRTDTSRYGNFDIILDRISRVSRRHPHPTRAVGRVLLGAQAYLVLIGACNPMICPIWGFRPRCLLVPLIMNHKDTRSLTGNRDSKSRAFSDFEIAGSTLAQRYLDQFPEWAYWASKFRDFFSGAWAAQQCVGLYHLNNGGRLPLRAPSLAQNMADSRTGQSALSVLDRFELASRPGLGDGDRCPSASETRLLKQMRSSDDGRADGR